MSDETTEPQTEGAPKKRPQPVNLAFIEAKERGIELDPVKPAKPAKAVKPEPAPEPAPPAPAPVVAEVVPEAAAPVEQPAPVEAAVVEEEAKPENQEPQPPSEGPEERSLAELAEASTKGRLSNAAEDRATMLMKDNLLTGGEDFLAALDAMPKLPWILAVRAIEQAWPLLVPEARPFLLDGLAKMGGMQSARLRLSVSRALMKLDLPVAVKIAASVCQAMVNPETGLISADESKLIGNVFIGRGKPWVLQLPLEALEDAEATAVVSAILFSVFNVNNPPITQLSILRYSAPKLGAVHPSLHEMIAKIVGRWNGKWQTALRRDCPVLPEAIAAVLKEERPNENAGRESRENVGRDGRNRRDGRDGRDARREPAPEGEEPETQPPLPAELEEKLKLAAEAGDADAVAKATQDINAWLDAQRAARKQQREQAPEAEPAEPSAEEKDDESRRGRGRDRDRGRGRERDRDREQTREKPPEKQPERAKERPAYVSRDQEGRGGAFNLSESLRGIEKYVSQLRNELGAMQTRLRRAEEGGRSRRPGTGDRVILSVEENNLSSEELKRLVVQLEARVADQEARITELTTDSEQRAESMAPGPDGEIPDAVTQLRTLLALKLSEDWADYLALENQEPDLVIQQHHRSIIRKVFGVLLAEGVPLAPKAELPPPPPEILPPPPAPVIDEEEGEEDDEELDAIPEPEPEILDDDEDDAHGLEHEHHDEHAGDISHSDEPAAPDEEASLAADAEAPQPDEPAAPSEDAPKKE
jgi:hypothetical protein